MYVGLWSIGLLVDNKSCKEEFAEDLFSANCNRRLQKSKALLLRYAHGMRKIVSVVSEKILEAPSKEPASLPVPPPQEYLSLKTYADNTMLTLSAFSAYYGLHYTNISI